MVWSLTIAATNQTSKVVEGTPTLRLNQFDVTLIDPSVIPAIGNAVAITTPTWAGTVTSVERRPGPRIGHDYCSVTATNTDVAGASAGPFGLSDTPGTPGGSVGYQDLRVRVSNNLDGTTTTDGSCTLFTTGLWPAMTFGLTNADLGYSATSFSVRDMAVTWRKGTPFYAMTFGDPIVTMSVWAADQAQYAPDGSISGTKITDLSVTTPKLAANAVTAAKVVVGGLGGGTNMVFNSSFESSSANWTLSAAGPPDIYSGVTSDVIHGIKALHFGASGSTKYAVTESSVRMTFQAGHWYTASVWVLGISATSSAGCGILMEATTAVAGTITNNAGTLGGTTPYSAPTAVAGVWTRLWVTWQQDATQTTRYVYLTNSYGGTGTGDVYMDAVQVEEGSIPTAFGVGPGDVKNSDGNVVIDSSGITVTNGAITVTNAGATVIIDGTSDMFRILATGTLSKAFPTVAAQIASATVLLTALGTFSIVPTMQTSITADSTAPTGSATSRWEGTRPEWSLNDGTISFSAQLETYFSGAPPATVFVQLTVRSQQVNPGTTGAGRYYLLAQTAL